MSFIQNVPLHRLLRLRVHSQASGARPSFTLRPAGAIQPVLFRPRGFAPPRRFPPRSAPSSLSTFSCLELRACCIPLSTMGFAAFRASQPTSQSLPRGSSRLVVRPRLFRVGRPLRAEDRSQQRWSHPPKLSPHQQPPPVTVSPQRRELPRLPLRSSVHRILLARARVSSCATGEPAPPQPPLTFPSCPASPLHQLPLTRCRDPGSCWTVTAKALPSCR